MKKYITIFIMISVLLLAGCTENEENHNSDNEISETITAVPKPVVSDDTSDNTSDIPTDPNPAHLFLTFEEAKDYADYDEMKKDVEFNQYLKDMGFEGAEPFYTYDGICGISDDEPEHKYLLYVEIYFDKDTQKGCGIRYENIRDDNGSIVTQIDSFPLTEVMQSEWEPTDYYELTNPFGGNGEDSVRDYKEFYEYNDDGRLLEFYSTGIYDDPEPNTEHTLQTFNYKYREDGSLYYRNYFASHLFFYTTYSHIFSIFDEQERVIYENSYITHGSYDSFYVYSGNEEIPKYEITLDNFPDEVYCDIYQYLPD